MRSVIEVCSPADQFKRPVLINAEIAFALAVTYAIVLFARRSKLNHFSVLSLRKFGGAHAGKERCEIAETDRTQLRISAIKHHGYRAERTISIAAITQTKFDTFHDSQNYIMT